MHQAPKPLLASVDGRAIGGGMGIACACDWVVATERATFALPELLWGLMPAIIWPVLTDRMAPHVVRQWTLAAHSRSAVEAHAAGLVDDLVPRRDARSRDRTGLAQTAPARSGCAAPPARVGARRRATYDLPAALRRGAELTAAMLRQPSVQQRWQAFAAGESPWSA